MMVNKQTVASSFGWSAIENAGLAVVSFLCLVLFARLLSPADFGLFSIALSIAELFGVILSMMFHDALVQRPSVDEAHFDTAFCATIVLSVATLALTVCCLLLIGSELARLVAGLCISLPFLGGAGVLSAYQRRRFEFRALAIRSLVARLLGGGAGIVLAFTGAGIWSLVAQQVLMAMLSFVVLLATCARIPRLRFDRRHFDDLISFGLYSLGSTFLRFATRRAFIAASGIFLGAVEAGYMNLSVRAVEMLWGVGGTAVSQVALPLLSRMQSDQAKLRQAFCKSTEFASLILAPCFVGLGVTASSWIVLGFGPQWLPSVPSTVVLCVVVMIQAPQLFTTPLLIAIGRPRYVLLSSVAELLAMVVLMSVVRPHTSGTATAVWFGSQFAYVASSAYFLRHTTSVSWRDQARGAVVPMASAIVMGGCIVALQRYGTLPTSGFSTLLLSASGGAVIYITFVALLDRLLIVDFLAMLTSAFALRIRNA